MCSARAQKKDREKVHGVPLPAQSLGFGVEVMGAVKGRDSSILTCRSKDGRRIWTRENKAVDVIQERNGKGRSSAGGAQERFGVCPWRERAVTGDSVLSGASSRADHAFAHRGVGLS